MWETQVRSLGQEDSIPIFLPGESHGQRSLADYSPWGGTELDMTEATWHVHVAVKAQSPIHWTASYCSPESPSLLPNL